MWTTGVQGFDTLPCFWLRFEWFISSIIAPIYDIFGCRQFDHSPLGMPTPLGMPFIERTWTDMTASLESRKTNSQYIRSKKCISYHRFGAPEKDIKLWCGCFFTWHQKPGFATLNTPFKLCLRLKKLELVGGLEHELYDFPSIGNSNPNWPFFFQRGWNHQPVESLGQRNWSDERWISHLIKRGLGLSTIATTSHSV